jgi:hypothetical protein
MPTGNKGNSSSVSVNAEYMSIVGLVCNFNSVMWLS